MKDSVLSMLSMVATAALSVGAMYLLTKGNRHMLKKKLDKLVMLSEEVSSSKDIARTTMRLQALNAELSHELLEELRKQHTQNVAAERAAQTHEERSSAATSKRLDAYEREQKETNAAILAALEKVVANTTPRTKPRARRSR